MPLLRLNDAAICRDIINTELAGANNSGATGLGSSVLAAGVANAVEVPKKNVITSSIWIGSWSDATMKESTASTAAFTQSVTVRMFCGE